MAKKNRGLMGDAIEWCLVYLSIPVLMYLHLVRGAVWPPYVVAFFVWFALLESLKYISTSGYHYYLDYGEEHQCLHSVGMRLFIVMYGALFSVIFFYCGWFWTAGAFTMNCLIRASVYIRQGSYVGQTKT